MDIADFSGLEHKTFDIGMVFLHEFQHGYFGLSDNVNKLTEIYSSGDPYYYKRGYRGDVADKYSNVQSRYTYRNNTVIVNDKGKIVTVYGKGNTGKIHK